MPNKWLKKRGIRQEGEMYYQKRELCCLLQPFFFYSLKHKCHFIHLEMMIFTFSSLSIRDKLARSVMLPFSEPVSIP